MCVGPNVPSEATDRHPHLHFGAIRDSSLRSELIEQPWTMEFTWHDLLFLHWSLPPASLRSLVPASLELDTYDSAAWVGVIPFYMSGIHLRRLPPFPGTSAFAEVNVRTYVRFRGQPGVYFFSLDAASFLAVCAARAWYHLPYFHARMSVANEGTAVRYSSRRRDHPCPADFVALYRPTSEVRCSQPDSLEYFLTERYCLFTTDRSQNVVRAQIHHQPWPLQNAEVELQQETLARAAGIFLPHTAPLAHFSRRLDVCVWRPERLSSRT